MHQSNMKADNKYYSTLFKPIPTVLFDEIAYPLADLPTHTVNYNRKS